MIFSNLNRDAIFNVDITNKEGFLWMRVILIF